MYSSNQLAPKQSKVLDFLAAFQRREGISPTCREIADHFGYKSPKAVTDHLAALEKKGYIRRHKGRSRGIELLSNVYLDNTQTVYVPIVGDVPAGYPELKDEQKLGRLAIDPSMLGGVSHHRLFALRVKGDSMVECGIMEGDWVVADKDSSPKIGDVVVALIDGDNTLKTLVRKKGKFYLKSENPDYPDWLPSQELVVQGIVKVVLRRI